MDNEKINLELVGILQSLVKDCPSKSFGQILQDFGFVRQTRPARVDSGVDWLNEYNESSEIILKRVELRILSD
jgi:hypothetical protein